jgi:glycosyltransferase involved in cell wall biosynthesis
VPVGASHGRSSAIDAALERSYDVCMITTRHALRDTRVYHKEAVSLARGLGLRVLVLAITDRDVLEQDGDIVVCGIAGSQRHVLRSVLRVGQVLLGVKAKVFHIHDFEDLVLLPFLKYLKHRPVIYDVHEYYELMIREVVALPNAVREPIARIAHVYEHLFSRLSDHVILVEERQKPHFERLGVPEERITVIRNLVSLKGFQGLSGEKRFELVYSGSCWAGRAIYELLGAIKLAQDRGRPLRALMMLIGKQDEIERFQARVAELGLAELVEVRPRVPFEAVPRGLSEGRIGIMLLHDSASHRAGIPTKVLEYEAGGLPVLVNDVNTFSVDHVERHRSGVVIEGLTPEVILDGLTRIEADYESFSARALEAAAANCWEADEAKLIGLYEDLLARSA